MLRKDKPKSKDVVSAIELGSSCVRVAIGACDDDRIEILGYAEKLSDGSVVKGEIMDMDKAVGILRDTLVEAESAAGMEIPPGSACVAVTGGHVVSRTGTGIVLVDTPDHIVTEVHVAEVETTAKKSADLASDEMVIDSFPEMYILDGKRRCDNPINQVARKVEAKVLVVVGNRNQTDNFLAPLRTLGVEDPRPVCAGLCSAIPSVLDDEHEKGVVFIDMGSGVADYSLLHSPSVLMSGVLPVGCDHVANDLSIALGLPFSPISRDLLFEDTSADSDFVKLPGEYANRRIPRETIAKVADVRFREAFGIIRARIEAAGLLGHAGAGVVFTGGAAEIPAAREALRSVFDMPVRVAGTELPDNFCGAISGLDSPGHSTILGVLAFGALTARKKSILSRVDRHINHLLKKVFRSMVKSIKF